ncbi:protein of unknown function [[Clostridium] fimetarium]|uniref:DUF4956 domain-containing protein n=2 Tax=[Clostridium] fimetarium TaxID=99656 RepID=A0A1I0MZ68_9FIRM|nr:protein of unknown function [[Clostridium] fimetarium]
MLASKKKGYNLDFIIGLVILPAIVSVVILLIGSNVARAFSMAGAFALVRFRSAPGSAKDIAVVFFSMASGLACGLGYITFAAIFVTAIIVVLLALSLSTFGEKKSCSKQLKITIPENLNYQSAFDDIFDSYTQKTELRNVKTTNMGTLFELTFIVGMKTNINEKAFIDEIRCRNGNLNISLGLIPDQSYSMLN